jgi:arachidonate 5-lipoxygenase
MSVEYFHPKTTPNIPVRKAVKMSMALPGTV